MMKNKLSLLLATTLVFVSGTAVAGSTDKNYFGIQYGVAGYDEKGVSETFVPTAVILRLGHSFNSNFSVEARLGTGLDDDTQFVPELGVDGINATLELDTIMAAYGVGHMDLAESISAYGMLGVSRVSATAAGQGFPASRESDSESGFSYGAGVDVDVSDSVALNVEYTQYLNTSDADLGVIAVGAVFEF